MVDERRSGVAESGMIIRDGCVGIGDSPCLNSQLRCVLPWLDLQVDLPVGARWKG